MPGRRPWPAAVAITLSGAVMVAGCSAGSGSPAAGAAGSSAPMAPCGTTRTAAGVPVNIEIAHGTVPCAAALAVERQYARALAAGKVPGNGGGAPAKVAGWVCQGFSTPQVLAMPSASATPS